MNTTTISLKDYIDKSPFVIPTYQRGYIWGKNRTDGQDDSVTNLIKTLIDKYGKNSEIFLQGVTVSKTINADGIHIIDGQQRTIFFYILLKFLRYNGNLEIRYEIREESNEYLRNIENDMSISPNEDERFQDIYFFKKTIEILRNELRKQKIDNEKFLNFLLRNVKFLYINIPKERAVSIFTMMNGNRAVMLQEELIKAEILRLLSAYAYSGDAPATADENMIEWEMIALRSRCAREWDKWLYWWNREDVRTLFGCKNTMGYLLHTYLKAPVSLEKLKKELKTKNVVKLFTEIRRLQKRFEDAFNDPISYNRIGAIIRLSDKDNKREFIEWYFSDKDKCDRLKIFSDRNKCDCLEIYYKLVFLNLRPKEIINLHTEKIKEEFEESLNSISDDLLYDNENKEIAFNLLLRLNIDEDNKLERKFDFTIWERRSLEHIYPKSKVIHYDEKSKSWLDGNNAPKEENNGVIKRENICEKNNNNATTEHSIGNLVLLYKCENSKLSDKSFDEKKIAFFDPGKERYFKSRHLLHTIYTFSKDTWNGEEIAINKKRIIEEFKTCYERILNEK